MQNETVNLFCIAFKMKIEQNSSDSIDWNCWGKYRRFLWQMNIFNSKKAVILIFHKKKQWFFMKKSIGSDSLWKKIIGSHFSIKKKHSSMNKW